MHYEKAYINGNRKEGKQPHPSLAQWSLPIPPQTPDCYQNGSMLSHLSSQVKTELRPGDKTSNMHLCSVPLILTDFLSAWENLNIRF